MLILWTEWHVPFVFVQHKASLEFSNKTYLAYFYDTAMIKVFGKQYQSTKCDVSTIFYGLGSITLFRFELVIIF